MNNQLKTKCLLALFALGVLTPVAYASSPHYLNGSQGIKAAKPAPPGFYWQVYNQYYSAKEVRNKYGHKINTDYKSSLYLLTNRFIYVTDKTILGGSYAADIIVPVAYTDVSVSKTFNLPLPNHMNFSDFTLGRSGHQFGFSDILIDPLILSWEGKQYDISIGLGAFIPTGKYDASKPASPGRGFWTFKPSAGGTIYFDEAKTWSASMMAHYEIHTKQKDTRQTPGNHFHFEWGVSKNIAQIFEVGVSGYHSWQVTNDKGPRSRNAKTRANAIGPELGAYIVPIGVDVRLRSQWEYKNRYNSQGNITTLTLTKPF